MLIIRLQRVGRKNDPSFRVIVTEKHKAANTGAFLELLGSYDARHDRIQLKEDRIKHWLSNGAQTSGTVHNLLVNAKIIEGAKINVSAKSNAKNETTSDVSEDASDAVETPEATAETAPAPENSAPETPPETEPEKEPPPEEQPKEEPGEEKTVDTKE